MANTPDYHWPPPEKRKVIGTSPKRLDGPIKSSGRAKYSSDLNLRGMLYGAYITSPHAHARVTAVDTGEAEQMKGVQAVYVAAQARHRGAVAGLRDRPPSPPPPPKSRVKPSAAFA